MQRTLEQRALAAGWRVLHSTGEERVRALERLQALTNWEIAFDIWLLTDPDPTIVEKIVRRHLLSVSPLRPMTSTVTVDWAKTVGWRPHLEVIS